MIRKPCQSDAGVQALLDPPVKPEDDGGGVALIGVPNDSRASEMPTALQTRVDSAARRQDCRLP